jgi:hypothetical protein
MSKQEFVAPLALASVATFREGLELLRGRDVSRGCESEPKRLAGRGLPEDPGRDPSRWNAVRFAAPGAVAPPGKTFPDRLVHRHPTELRMVDRGAFWIGLPGEEAHLRHDHLSRSLYKTVGEGPPVDVYLEPGRSVTGRLLEPLLVSVTLPLEPEALPPAEDLGRRRGAPLASIARLSRLLCHGLPTLPTGRDTLCALKLSIQQ